ncbi:MAG: DUF4340 domain-containing protein [Pseudomonadota bacterium]
MKLKKEYVILFAVIATLSSYLILHKSDRTHYRLPELPDVSGADVSKIEISKAGNAILLERSGSSWQISPQGYRCDSEKIKDMLGFIEKLSLTELVSGSKNYDRYGLDDHEKITVRAWQGETLKREFDVGKAAATFRHTFVKIAGDHRVYHALQNFRREFDQTVDSLRDKTVLSFVQSEIREMRLVRDRESLFLSRVNAPVKDIAGRKTGPQNSEPEKPEMLWHGPEGTAVDESRLRGLLAALSDLRCDTYIRDKNKGDFSNPVYSIVLKGETDYSLSIFEKIREEDAGYPAVSSESNDAFELSNWQAEKIMLSRDELLTKPEIVEKPKQKKLQP